jgi:hypothetical protein
MALYSPLFVTTSVTLERVWFGIIVIVDMEGYNPRSKLIAQEIVVTISCVDMS